MKLNNHVFKGHKTLLGTKYVTFREQELPLRYELFSQSEDGFDWGCNGAAPLQLAFSMLYELTDENFAKKNALKFSTDVIRKLTTRDWIMESSEVLTWLKQNTDFGKEEIKQVVVNKPLKSTKRKPAKKSNIIKDVCTELDITQKELAQILEVPEGTVSSWAVKNEIPRLGKKAIEFYILNKQNQKIVDSYKNFMTLLQSA